MKIEMKIEPNQRNRKVVTNIKEIVTYLLEDRNMTKAEIARRAGIHQTSVNTWMEKGRADVKAVKKLYDSFGVEKEVTTPKEMGTDNFSTLWYHVKSIKALGFDVTLTPNFDGTQATF